MAILLRFIRLMQGDFWLAATTIVCVAVTAFTLRLFVFKRGVIHHNGLTTENTYDDAEKCKQILARGTSDSSEHPNNLKPIASRAIPNGRLIRAFNIDNAFTTSEDARRIGFKKLAKEKIRLSETEVCAASARARKNAGRNDTDSRIIQWKTIADFAKELVRSDIIVSQLYTVGATTTISLDNFVRSICLKIILHKVFGENPFRMKDELISTIADDINDLWIQSKTSNVPGSR